MERALFLLIPFPVAMKIHEYQAKEILRAFGVATPRGHVTDSPEEAGRIAKEFGGRAVVKAQIHAGGRGKGGGRVRRPCARSGCEWRPRRGHRWGWRERAAPWRGWHRRFHGCCRGGVRWTARSWRPPRHPRLPARGGWPEPGRCRGWLR